MLVFASICFLTDLYDVTHRPSVVQTRSPEMRTVMSTFRNTLTVFEKQFFEVLSYLLDVTQRTMLNTTIHVLFFYGCQQFG